MQHSDVFTDVLEPERPCILSSLGLKDKVRLPGNLSKYVLCSSRCLVWSSILWIATHGPYAHARSTQRNEAAAITAEGDERTAQHSSVAESRLLDSLTTSTASVCE